MKILIRSPLSAIIGSLRRVSMDLGKVLNSANREIDVKAHGP